MSYHYRGGKLKRWNELSFDEQVGLLYDLLNAFAILKNPDDAALFLTDLLTSDEVKFLSKRLRIAKLLLNGSDYSEIRSQLKASPSTIAKVSAWLKEKGDGFRNVIKRIPQRTRPVGGYEFPRFFWPGRLLEDIQKGSTEREGRKFNRVLKTLRTKDVIHHKIDEQFKEEVGWRNRKKQK